MSFINRASKTNNEIIRFSTDMLSDVHKAFLGDGTAISRIIYTLSQMPFIFRERLFWSKMEQFLNGVYLNENDCSDLRAKLAAYGEEEENIYRLIAYIDRAETKKKIRYLINVTRCLLTGFIDLDTYFRICNAVTYTLEEDLQYLRNHITEDNIAYNASTQGLYANGLMYQSTIEVSGRQFFSFSPIGKMVDKYAVSYDDDARYPNPAVQSATDDIPKTQLPIDALDVLEDDDIDSLFLKKDVT